MNLAERQKAFLEHSQRYFGATGATRTSKLFGVSNSAKIIEGGIQLGVPNLDGVRDETDKFILACVIKLPPGDEVYFAVLVRRDRASFLSRLAEMKKLGAAAKSTEALQSTGTDVDNADTAGTVIRYSTRNNLVAVYLAEDGKIYLRNAGFWNSLGFDLGTIGPGVDVDSIAVALHPAATRPHGGHSAREMVSYLSTIVGQEKIRDLAISTMVSPSGVDIRAVPTIKPGVRSKLISTLNHLLTKSSIRS